MKVLAPLKLNVIAKPQRAACKSKPKLDFEYDRKVICKGRKKMLVCDYQEILNFFKY